MRPRRLVIAAAAAVAASLASFSAPAHATDVTVEPGTRASTFWVTNPTSSARLYVKVFLPSTGTESSLPGVVLVPGGSGDSSSFTRPSSNLSAQSLADRGYVVAVFDPDGRGRSEGSEDYDGSTQQDGLADVVRFLEDHPRVDASHVGIVSKSFGVTMAMGASTRHPEANVAFLVDWEGPADRNDTGGCTGDVEGHLDEVAACDDEDFWSEREAVTFAASLAVPYARLQSETDHVQPDYDHAVAMVNAALTSSPSVYLNRAAVTAELTSIPAPVLVPDSLDPQLTLLVDEAVGTLGF